MTMKRDARSDQKLPRMDWYPQDYLSDPKTRSMSLEEHGAYFLLLQFEWIGGPLPSDHSELASLLGVTPEVFARLWRRVGACFVPLGPHLVNTRLERERARALGQRLAKRLASEAGNQKRWGQLPFGDVGSQPDPTGIPTGVPTDSGWDRPSPSPSPSLPPYPRSEDRQPPQDRSTTPEPDAITHAFAAIVGIRRERGIIDDELRRRRLEAQAAIMLAKAGGDVDLVRTAARLFHRSEDTYISSRGWPMKVLVSRFDFFLSAARATRSERASKDASTDHAEGDAASAEHISSIVQSLKGRTR